MDDLTARLEALLRLYVAADDIGQGCARMADKFRKDLELLVAKYGLNDVDAALDKMPDETWSSISMH